jgi:hypothetical protein
MASPYRSQVLAQVLDGKRSWSHAVVNGDFDVFKTEIVAPLRELRGEGIVEQLSEISAAIDGDVYIIGVDIIGAINYHPADDIE